MSGRATVVRQRERVTKHRLHSLLMLGWQRCIARLGKGAFADALEITTAGLDKQLTGSMPGFDAIDAAFDVDDTVLDAWAEHKGYRIVPAGALCTTDAKVGPVLVAALHKVVEAEADGTVDHLELFGMESELRAARRCIDVLIERITDLRKPRAA